MDKYSQTIDTIKIMHIKRGSLLFSTHRAYNDFI